jgi:hypothetical protein
MLHEANGDDALSQTNGLRFKNERTSMKDNEWSGRPSTSRSTRLISQVRIIHSNQVTVREVAEKSGISTLVQGS